MSVHCPWGMNMPSAVPEIRNPAKSPSPVPENYLPHYLPCPIHTHIHTTVLPPQNKLRQTTLTLPESMLFLLILEEVVSHMSV